MEVRFIEKKKSPIPGFYSAKILVLAPDREVPVIVYLDEAGEKVILGTLIIKGDFINEEFTDQVLERYLKK